MVSFSYRNLVVDDYPSLMGNTNAMDLVICRNVLIYFSGSTNQAVVARLHASLNETGWLIVGHAEPSQELFHQFSVRNFPGTIVYQKTPGGDQPAPAPPRLPPRMRGSEATARTRRPSVAAKPPAPVVAPPMPVARARGVMTKLPSPPSSEIRSVLALLQDRQTEIALTQLEALSTTHPHELWVPYLLAKTHADRLELTVAEAWIDKALTQAPLLAPAHYLRGLILQELERLDESLEALRGCIYADPEFWMGHFSMAGLLARLGRPQRAEKALDTLQGLLAVQDSQTPVPEGDGLTVGRLCEFVSAQKESLR